MELRLYKGGDSCGSEICIRFPAELDAVWSAIDELEQYSTGDGPVRIEEAVCPVANLTGYVRCANLEEGADIQKLDLLALKINGMTQEKQRLFSAALEFERTGGLDDAIHIADSLGRYEIFPKIKTDEDLGRFLVDTSFMTGKFSFPEASVLTWTMPRSVRSSMTRLAVRIRSTALSDTGRMLRCWRKRREQCS